MKYVKFSKKQLFVLTWWLSDKYKNKKGIICDGSVRAGKTSSMAISFIMWAMHTFDGVILGMSGKTVGSFERNVLTDLMPSLKNRGYQCVYKRKDATLIISIYDKETKKTVTNTFIIFGGRDEGSYTLIQGLTAAGWFFDEVALQPESFVNQALSRCSVDGSKFWFNCNPDRPNHWFKKEFIDQTKKKNLIHIHFLMEDNPSLSQETIEDYKNRFIGLFYLRYIKGLWALAEGIIYDMFSEDKNIYTDLENEIGKEISIERYFVVDYGVTNPFVVLDVRDNWECAYIENEIYYDSKETNHQLTDEEMADKIGELVKEYYLPPERIIIDPSATSLKVVLRNRGYLIKDADNNVKEGIGLVSSALYQGKLKINKGCKNTIEEFGSYVWDVKAKERGEEKPLKVSDHGMDCIRYYCNTIMKNRILGKM